MRQRPRQGLQLDQLLPKYSSCGRQHYAEVQALNIIETSHVGPLLGSPCPSCHRHAQQVVRPQHHVREAYNERQFSAEWDVSLLHNLKRAKGEHAEEENGVHCQPPVPTTPIHLAFASMIRQHMWIISLVIDGILAWYRQWRRKPKWVSRDSA